MTRAIGRPVVVGDVRPSGVELRIYTGRDCPACRGGCPCRCTVCDRSGREVEEVALSLEQLHALHACDAGGALAAALLRAVAAVPGRPTGAP